MSDTTRPTQPADRLEVIEVLDAMRRQIDLIGCGIMAQTPQEIEVCIP